MNKLYLGINLASIAVPLLASFYKPAPFIKTAKALFPALFISAALFIIWDIYFTKLGVWGFNQKYVLGPNFFGLPLEECLFFFCIPFSCGFIYFSVKTLSKNSKSPLYQAYLCMAGLALVFGAVHTDKYYTSWVCFLGALQCIYLWITRPTWTNHFLLAYVISILPFLLVNGVLTGTWLSEPIVWYNNNENVGIRLGTIPVEDFVYSFTMQVLFVVLYEFFLQSKRVK